ncbi:MAG TPA: DUF1572 domain-containing protein [Ferruginibacter sp.]|nr:DUF1572 domain-containing protein [Chitinophagaceae bacterium]HRI24311.1 DUF1572 domain-containing protein [Ferruginibacter sp.]
MNASAQTANRLREVILNGTWIANTNFNAQLSDLSWQQATQQIGALNSIAILSSHIHYYIAGVLNVLEGGTLNIKDKFSFDFPPIQSQHDWQAVTGRLWADTERLAACVERMTHEEMQADFAGKQYGSYQRNIDALIEHCYYHLGQIVLIKKMVLAAEGG